MKHVLRLCATFVLVVCGLASTAAAQQTARLYLQAAPLQDETLLVVDVRVAEVEDLYGAEFQLVYDPAQLEVQDADPRLEGIQIAPGSFLPAANRFVVNNQVDPEEGRVNYAVTLLNPAPPVSGEGVLASVAFKRVGSGSPTVRVDKAQLASSELGALPVLTEDLPLMETMVPPTAEAQTAPTPGPGTEVPGTQPEPVLSTVPGWALWALGISFALLFLIIIVLLIGRIRRSTSQPADSAQAGPRPMPGNSLSSSQSSANLTEQGQRATERGDMQMAYELFSRAVELDPGNAQAWLGKGLVAQQATEKRICFQRVIALDPDNSVATTELQQLAGSS